VLEQALRRDRLKRANAAGTRLVMLKPLARKTRRKRGEVSQDANKAQLKMYHKILSSSA
jgi:hypothetical protein